jgi:hypothetical protein
MSLIVKTTLNGVESLSPVADEHAGRAAWLAAIGRADRSYASLERASGPVRERYLCEWSRQGAFLDCTAEHAAELGALAAVLTSGAPAGYAAAVVGDSVRFTGSPHGPHSLNVAVSTTERMLAHWDGYLPARGPFTIRATNDMGNDGTLLVEHLGLRELRAWLDRHEDSGTFEIIDESDGRPACGYDTEMAGGAWACDCGRATCPSHTADFAEMAGRIAAGDVGTTRAVCELMVARGAAPDLAAAAAMCGLGPAAARKLAEGET